MTTNLKCLLLDDELPALSYMKVLCEEIPGVEVVKAFNDPVKFLEAIHHLDFNACILDIQMPEHTGLEIAQHLKDKLIIFTTAYKEFAAEAFDLNAVDYIRKPLQKDRFEKAITKAKAILQTQIKTEIKQALWNTDKGKTVLAFNDILYITASENDSRDKFVYLEKGLKTTIKNTSFEQLLSVLPTEKFCRVNKKEIIALKAVVHFTSDEIKTSIQLKNGSVINLVLGEVYRDEFKLKIKA
ncbi:MAG: response regulator transcription factor [Burkholderiales bacterium]|nr:response regulator transcription factor [Bacteroidia bacterium]